MGGGKGGRGGGGIVGGNLLRNYNERCRRSQGLAVKGLAGQVQAVVDCVKSRILTSGGIQVRST